jgi:eukaryotic-like serine/threonine-protein kinase
MNDSRPMEQPPTGAQTPRDDRSTVSEVPATSTDPTPGPRPTAPAPAVSGYEILGVLGRGGMGVVYKARDLKLQRLVALKMILAGSHASASELARFRIEAEAIARLKHPNIVQIYEIGAHEGLPYFSLELVEGGSLAKKLEHQPRPPKQSAQIAETLARAMQAAHEHGVIHRDLKPANVLVDHGWVLKITDFGLARKLDESVQTHSGAVMGTPSYMAPEQASGQVHAIGPAADIYALGALLYELLTGRPPFKAATSVDTLVQVVHDEPVPPRQLQPKTPLDVETICLKCLQKSPARRYASAAELAEDLRRFQAGEPIVARPVSTLERGWRLAKRRPTVAGLLAGIVVVTAISLLSLFILWQSAEVARGDAVYQEQLATGAKGALESKNADLAAASREVAAKNTALQEALRDVTRAKDESEQRRQTARRHLYTAHLNLMQIAWRDRLLDFLDELLDKQLPQAGDLDLRGFEYHYIKRLLERSRRAFTGHADTVTAVTFSPDRRLLASGSRDGVVKVWELATALEVHSITAHTGAVGALAFGPSGRLLATVGQDGNAHVFETTTAKKLWTAVARSATAGSLAFNPDGTLLATAGNPAVTLHDALTGKESAKFEGHAKAATAVTFSLDGKRAASAADDGTVCIWEVASAKELHRQSGLKVRLSQLSFPGPGRHLVLTTPQGALAVWDPDAKQNHIVFSGNGAAVACRRDVGQVCFIGPPDTVRVCDPAANRELFNLRGHTAAINSLTYSADGALLATGGADRAVRVWAVVGDMEALDLSSHRGVVNSVAYSPDAMHLASASADGTLRVREAATGQEVLLLQPHRRVQPRVAVIDQTHVLAGVTAVAYSADGQRLATGGADADVIVCDAATGKTLHTLSGHKNAVTSVAFSPDGKLLASSSWDATVRLWDIASGTLRHTLRHTLRGHRREVTRVAFHPEGKLLASSSWDQTIKLWDADTGSEVGALTAFVGPRPAPVDSVAFHPDGRHLVAADNPFAWGGHVKLFDLQTKQEVRSFRGHAYGIYQVVLSKDGRRLATASCKGNVKVWDTDTGQEMISYQNRTPRKAGEDSIDQLRTDAAHSVAFSPDSQRLAIGCRNSKVMVLDAAPPTPALLVDREAYRLVSALFDELHEKNRVLEYLRGPAVLSAALRKEAQLRAERFLLTRAGSVR